MNGPCGVYGYMVYLRVRGALADHSLFDIHGREYLGNGSNQTLVESQRSPQLAAGERRRPDIRRGCKEKLARSKSVTV